MIYRLIDGRHPRGAVARGFHSGRALVPVILAAVPMWTSIRKIRPRAVARLSHSHNLTIVGEAIRGRPLQRAAV